MSNRDEQKHELLMWAYPLAGEVDFEAAARHGYEAFRLLRKFGPELSPQ